MLSRKQLKAMSKCNENITCMNCIIQLTNCYNCNVEAAKTALELLDQIEAQQKEIEKLKEENKAYKFVVNKGVEALEENHKLKDEKETLNNSYINAEMNLEHMTKLYEQLKVDNAVMQEALGLMDDCITATYNAIGGGQ